MQVKVNFENMTLKIMDCDILEGMVLEQAHDKTIEVVLVDVSSPGEDLLADVTDVQPNEFLEFAPSSQIELTKQDLENMLAQLTQHENKKQ